MRTRWNGLYRVTVDLKNSLCIILLYLILFLKILWMTWKKKTKSCQATCYFQGFPSWICSPKAKYPPGPRHHAVAPAPPNHCSMNLGGLRLWGSLCSNFNPSQAVQDTLKRTARRFVFSWIISDVHYNETNLVCELGIGFSIYSACFWLFSVWNLSKHNWKVKFVLNIVRLSSNSCMCVSTLLCRTQPWVYTVGT